ncbi:MAG: M48 family metalloprotease [Leptolyngbyaceae cyanobacterium]
MSDLPPSSLPPSSVPAASPELILKQGLAALQRTDHAAAIQYFAGLSQDQSVPGGLRLKARIGWIKALKRDGQIAPAITVCQPLTRHPQAKVQQWATDILAQLTAAQSAAASASRSRAPEDLSGFQPLDSDQVPPVLDVQPSATKSPATQSGFQPLTDDAPAIAASPTSPLQPAPPADSGTLPGDDAPPAVPPSPSPVAADLPNRSGATPPTASLFHYEQLNQTTTPVESVAPPSPGAAETSEPHDVLLTFQSEERLDRSRSLPARPQLLWRMWLGQAIAAIAVFWLCRFGVQWGLSRIAAILMPLRRVAPIPLGWRDSDFTVVVICGLVALLLASPWLLDWLLQRTAGLKPLPIQTLQKKHPEGCRLLRRINQQQGWLLPILQDLPTSVPLIFSYGWLPRYSRIVISRGLRDQLTDEELATLIGYELSHITQRTLPGMSLMMLLLLFFHQGYWQLARWGDRQTGRATTVGAALCSSICYGLYWLFRKVTIPAARSRVLLSDRQTTAWTGNPNALIQALAKVEAGIAQSIMQTGFTPPLLEATDLFTPVGYEAAIGLGSFFPQPEFLAAIAWDLYNPYRRWLSLNSSHPSFGERLKQMTTIALKWQLAPAIPLPECSNNRSKSTQGAFLSQISPYIGPFIGVVAAMVLWFLSGLLKPLGLWQVGWIYGDRSVVWGILLLSIGMGFMFSINRYFPDITAGNRLKDPSLAALYQNPCALPTVSQPVRLTGKLLGRPGMANWLCQDFIAQTPNGLLKLHFFSLLGPPGNLLIHPGHPSHWVGRYLDIQGWYRRGAIAWMDIDTLGNNGRSVAKANHPMWSVLVCLGCCLWGLITLLRG